MILLSILCARVQALGVSAITAGLAPAALTLGWPATAAHALRQVAGVARTAEKAGKSRYAPTMIALASADPPDLGICAYPRRIV